MSVQDQAANGLAAALAKHHMGDVRVAFSADGCEVSVNAHPQAKVYFKRDQMGGLLTEFVFDGRPPERLNYVPSADNAAKLAQDVVDRIAGVGGGSPTA